MLLCALPPKAADGSITYRIRTIFGCFRFGAARGSQLRAGELPAAASKMLAAPQQRVLAPGAAKGIRARLPSPYHRLIVATARRDAAAGDGKGSAER